MVALCGWNSNRVVLMLLHIPQNVGAEPAFAPAPSKDEDRMSRQPAGSYGSRHHLYSSHVDKHVLEARARSEIQERIALIPMALTA